MNYGGVTATTTPPSQETQLTPRPSRGGQLTFTARNHRLRREQYRKSYTAALIALFIGQESSHHLCINRRIIFICASK